jgi:hypothetical protein
MDPIYGSQQPRVGLWQAPSPPSSLLLAVSFVWTVALMPLASAVRLGRSRPDHEARSPPRAWPSTAVAPVPRSGRRGPPCRVWHHRHHGPSRPPATAGGTRPAAEAAERSGGTGGLMGRSGPSASQAKEVSTASRRVGIRLSSTRDGLEKGPLNETRRVLSRGSPRNRAGSRTHGRLLRADGLATGSISDPCPRPSPGRRGTRRAPPWPRTRRRPSPRPPASRPPSSHAGLNLGGGLLPERPPGEGGLLVGAGRLHLLEVISSDDEVATER